MSANADLFYPHVRRLLSVILDTPVLHNSIFQASVQIGVLGETLAEGCDLLNQLLQFAVWYVWQCEQYHHCFVTVILLPPEWNKVSQ